MPAVAAQTQRRVLAVGDTGPSVRASVSPLATVTASLLEVVAGFGRGAPPSWRAQILDRASAVDLVPFAIFDLWAGELPNFLLPAPVAGSATIGEEIERLRATSDETMARDLHDLAARGETSDALAPYLGDPRRALDRHCAALADYWDRVFATSWPRLREIVERNVLELGLRLVTGGPEAALRGLHPRIGYEGDSIVWTSDEPLLAPLGGRTVVVAPIVCGAGGLLANDTLEDAVVLAPAARGVGEAWGEPRSEGQELERVLGQTRARVLRRLATPSTTTGLSGALRLAPATVSHHLCALADAGLVSRGRRGRRVYYRLSRRGAQLVALF